MSEVTGVEANYDERRDAELMANHFKTEHYEQVLNAGDLKWSLPRVVYHLEDLRVGMSYPNYYISKNKIELTSEINVDEVLEGVKAKYAAHPINTIDGVKIEFNKEWVHLRKSNTEPIIRIYSESESMTTADNLAEKIISDIKEIITSK
jgi:phosphomannomutase